MENIRTEMISINTLYEYATPCNGAYKNNIGHIQYTTPDGQVYKTLVMTKTDHNFAIERTVTKKKIKTTYKITAGYI